MEWGAGRGGGGDEHVCMYVCMYVCIPCALPHTDISTCNTSHYKIHLITIYIFTHKIHQHTQNTPPHTKDTTTHITPPQYTEVKATETAGPVLIHIITEKGRGYLPAESASDKMHGVTQFDPLTGKQSKPKTKAGSYTNYFADALVAEARADSRVVGIHAAMGGGTGMNRFEKYFAERTFDVGIAEQHAVTFAAGLACEGLVPFCAIYSTFLQRGYDQVVHDVALQKLPGVLLLWWWW